MCVVLFSQKKLTREKNENRERERQFLVTELAILIVADSKFIPIFSKNKFFHFFDKNFFPTRIKVKEPYSTPCKILEIDLNRDKLSKKFFSFSGCLFMDRVSF